MKVIWANQNHPKLKKPFATLWLYGSKEKAQAETRLLDDKLLTVIPKEAVLEVQLYGTSGTFPYDDLENFVHRLSLDRTVEKCVSAGVAFFDSDAVQDISGLLDDNQTYECRAAVDLHIRYMGVISENDDELYFIEQVEVEGRYLGSLSESEIQTIVVKKS